MAFKILSEEQIALLTENQKQQYEKELDIYEERSAFVERMHILENAEIPPYEPKLQNIAVMDEVPEVIFNRQEYIAKRCTSITKPDLQFRVPEIGEPMCTVLPPESRRAVPVIPRQIPIVPETASPDIPDKVVLDVPGLAYAAPQMTEPFLPEVAVNIAEVRSFHEVENPQIELPTALKPNIAVEVKKIESAQAVLPQSAKIEPVKADFKKPEIPAAVLQPIAKTEPLNVKFEKPEIPTAVLERTAKTEPLNVKFEKPEISAAEFQPIAKIESVNTKFEKPEIQKAGIPKVSKAEPVTADFETPEIVISGLPEVSKPDPAVRDIALVEQPAVDLPAFRKISAIDMEVKPVERREIQIAASPIKIAVVKSFTGIESKAEGLPPKASVPIPNAYEALKELLPLTKEPEALEEISS